jgi:hypothetical protein
MATAPKRQPQAETAVPQAAPPEAAKAADALSGDVATPPLPPARFRTRIAIRTAEAVLPKGHELDADAVAALDLPDRYFEPV